jgi:hypothetical protein
LPKNLSFSFTKKLSIWSERLVRLSALFFLVIFLFYPTKPIYAQFQMPDVDLASLEVRLGALKDDFEATILQSKEQSSNIQQALSWKSISLTLIAAVSALEPELYGDYFETKQGELEATWKEKNTSWDRKIIFAMKLCDEALTRLIVLLADKHKNHDVINEFKSIMSLHGVDSSKAKAEPTKLAEMKVYWSNRLVALFPLVIKIMAPRCKDDLDDILEDLLNRADIISSRRDIHYQAKMDILYLNNVQSLTNMFFLLSTLPESSIHEVATNLKNEWDLSLRDQALTVSYKSAISLISATQVSFNLALWYVTYK